MKKLIAFVASLLVASTSAYAAPTACSTVYTLPHSNFIYKNSAPLRNSRGVMIGLRYEPTLIMKARFSARSTTVYAENGKAIGSCPWTSAHGFAGGRMRCTMSTAGLRASAQSTGRSPAGYFTLGGGKCAKVPHLGKCYGSSKGGCSRTL